MDVAGRFEISFKRSTCPNPKIMPAVDAPRRLMRQTDSTNKPLVLTAHVSVKVLTWWTPDYGNLDAGYWGLWLKNVRKSGWGRRGWGTGSWVWKMSNNGISDLRVCYHLGCTSYDCGCNDNSNILPCCYCVSKILEDKLNDSLQLKHEVAEKRVKIPLSRFIGGIIVDIIHQGELDPLLTRNIKTFIHFDKFMSTLPQRVAWCKSLIRQMAEHVNLHMLKVEEEHCLSMTLRQELSETACQPQLTSPKLEAGIFNTLTSIQSQTDLNEKVRLHPKPSTEGQKAKDHLICWTNPDRDTRGKWNHKSGKDLVLGDSGAMSSRTEPASNYKSKDSLKQIRKAKKCKVVRLVRDMSNMEWVFNTFCMVRRTLSYDHQVMKHVTN